MATAKIVELDDSNMCKICENALARYSCPRCNIIYCSLNCYRSENHLQCSESFYKDLIMEDLQANAGEESKKKMLEILSRTHENNRIPFDEEAANDHRSDEEEELDSDDDEFIDISERLAGVNLDDAEQVWEKLTEDERQEFVAFLRSEDVSKLIQPWEPWWLYRNSSKVEDLSDNTEWETAKNKCPKLVKIKDFSKITSKSPSESVRFNLINIIASYALTARYFNGEHFDFALEAATYIATTSQSLKNAENFNDFETAVKSVEQECINCEWMVTDKENLETMRFDLQKILDGPNFSNKNFYILSALADLSNILSTAISKCGDKNSSDNKPFSTKFPNNQVPSIQYESKTKLKSYVRKIDYFLSYTKYHFKL